MTLIITLSIIGIVLVLAELVLPGGVVGIGGIGCLIVAVALIFKNYGINAGAFATFVLTAFCITAFLLWMKHFNDLPLTRHLVLKSAIDDRSREHRLAALLGKSGIACTPIAPSGQIEIDGEKIDVLAEVGVIAKGDRAEIVAIKGPSIFVRKSG